MWYIRAMHRAAKQIPVIWRTEQSVVNRLLGETGRPLLDQLLAETQTVAAKRKWPLQKIKVEHYQDPEVDWEYLVLTLDFDCPRPEAKKLWVNYLEVVGAMDDGLEGTAKDIFTKMIYYDFESDP